MSEINTNDIRAGTKLEIEGQPFLVLSIDFVKPGKGQAFNKVRIRNLITGRTIDKTFKSNDKVDLADIEEESMRMLYKEGDDVVFMNDANYDQVHISNKCIGDNVKWLMEDQLYDVIFYKGNAITISPPTFMELLITETAPGDRGNTASGRVMKPAILETGAEILVPIFVEQDEKIKVDTRTSEYVSRVST